MNLILWRHADAEDGVPDLGRKLTPRGRKQAARLAKWLRRNLPERYATIASPAARACETAGALTDAYTVDPGLAPGADVAHYIAASRWPEGPPEASGTVVVVGHQPTIGRLASLLLSGAQSDWSVKKGAIWWLSTRDRAGREEVVLRAVVAPDQLG